MYRKIVVGFNDDGGSRDALALGRLIADAKDGRLMVTGVFPESPSKRFASASMLEAAREAEVELRGKVDRAASQVGGEAAAFASRSPARGLHDAIEELGADLVVVGSSSRAGVGRVLAGSVALQLLDGSPCAMAVAPKDFREADARLRVIGVGIDDAEQSREALRAAVELARACKAKIRLLSAINPGAADEVGWAYGRHSWTPTLRGALEEILAEAAKEVPEALAPTTRLVEGNVAASLIREAENGIDLLFVGSRGYGPIRRVLLGSVSGALVKSAPCPVLVVPRGVHNADGWRTQ